MKDNVILITVDSLRADYCGFVRDDLETTPTLDEMAREGISCPTAIAPASSTPESMGAVHTGDFVTPYRDEVVAPYVGQDEILPARQSLVSEVFSRRRTLAETFSRAGYETLAFTPNTFTSRHFGFDAGFDHYQDYLQTNWLAKMYQHLFEKHLDGSNWLTPVRLGLQRLRGSEMFKPWTELYADIVRATQTVDEPYFLWVLLLDTHLPYLSDRQEREISWLDMWRYNIRMYRSVPSFTDTEREVLLSAYEATVRRVDSFLSRLQDDLGDTNPITAIHADHGEAFGEHGTYGHGPYVYEENIRVPLVVHGTEESGEVNLPVSLRSLAPTLADLAGVEHGFRAPNLFAAEGPVLSNVHGRRSAVRGADWKYIRDNVEGSEELYSLVDDPGERENVKGNNEWTAGALSRVLDRQFSEQREKKVISSHIRRLLDTGSV